MAALVGGTKAARSATMNRGAHGRGAAAASEAKQSFKARNSWPASRAGGQPRGYFDNFYLIPITIESGPPRCSTRASRNPASFIQPTQSAPV